MLLRHTPCFRVSSVLASGRRSPGHGTIAIAMDLYSHLMNGMETAAAAKIDEAFGKARSGTEID